MTLFKGLKALIVGDIIHSRVAKTNLAWLEKLEVEVKVSGPTYFADPKYRNVVAFDNLEHYDLLMLLRYQSERHAQDYHLHNEQFHAEWGLTHERYQTLKPKAIILHPGPVNRGVEIAADLVEAPKSRINEQVTNGTYIRAALIWLLLTEWQQGIN